MFFNNNKQRREWWETMQNRYTDEEIKEAMKSLKEEAREIITLHYGHTLPLKDIALKLARRRAMSVKFNAGEFTCYINISINQ